ncbi:MAG TPA: hypothetical protein DF364_06660 [Ruminococcaceae bacterium]|nr:hypothetical protein [Oscillospiraceae bacterium]
MTTTSDSWYMYLFYHGDKADTMKRRSYFDSLYKKRDKGALFLGKREFLFSYGGNQPQSVICWNSCQNGPARLFDFWPATGGPYQ